MPGITPLTEDRLYELLLAEDVCVPELERLSDTPDAADNDGAFLIEIGQPGQTARDIVGQLLRLERRQPELVSVRIAECGLRPNRKRQRQAMARRVRNLVCLICPRCRLVEDQAS